MTAKSLIIVGALCLSSVAFAKSYDIVLNNPSRAGATELKPGEYKLKVEGSQVIFSREGKEWTVPVKAGAPAAKKFEQTTIESSNQGDMDTIKAIDLAGSNTKLEVTQ